MSSGRDVRLPLREGLPERPGCMGPLAARLRAHLSTRRQRPADELASPAPLVPEQVPYRRTLIGFTAREFLNARSPGAAESLEDAAGVWLEVEEEEEEEDLECVPTA